MDLYIISSGRLDAVMTEEEGLDEKTRWMKYIVLNHMDPVLLNKTAIFSSSCCRPRQLHEFRL